jgi:uncharacterized membrane protein
MRRNRNKMDSSDIYLLIGMMFFLGTYLPIGKSDKIVLITISLVWMIITLIMLLFERRITNLTRRIEIMRYEQDIENFNIISSKLNTLIELMRKNKRRNNNEKQRI